MSTFYSKNRQIINKVRETVRIILNKSLAVSSAYGVNNIDLLWNNDTYSGMFFASSIKIGANLSQSIKSLSSDSIILEEDDKYYMISVTPLALGKNNIDWESPWDRYNGFKAWSANELAVYDFIRDLYDCFNKEQVITFVKKLYHYDITDVGVFTTNTYSLSESLYKYKDDIELQNFCNKMNTCSITEYLIEY